MPRGDYGKLKAAMETAEQVSAPIARHAPQGTLRISLGEELLAERPLVALASVDEGNLWQRLSDRVRLMLECANRIRFGVGQASGPTHLY